MDLVVQELNKERAISYPVWLMCAVILMLDQLTKFLTYQFIPSMDQSYYVYPYNGIGVFKDFFGIDFSLNYLTNRGAAWGFLGDYQLPLVIFRIALIIGMCIYLKRSKYPLIWQIPFALIIVGAIGNVLDYFIYGHVIDMFHFVFWGYEFPVFNIADSAISIGICALFLLSWLKPSPSL